ncbi:hypothetical protein ACQPXM_27725 [Kribbella sp. CA-253562]|uniref:hypothetical protein n=1 Tax=Kribbella sp. CA-253562 TaxID=3239942 RepID=UPI003D8DD75A
MPVDIEQFTTAVSRARDRIRGTTEPGVIATEQAKLLAMVPADATEHEKTWTTELIAGLAVPSPPPPQPSALYDEAGRIHADAFRTEGPTEERIAALQDARRKIFALADRADDDEAAAIRAMTRALDHAEDYLRDPPWPASNQPGQAD